MDLDGAVLRDSANVDVDLLAVLGDDVEFGDNVVVPDGLEVMLT